MMLFKFLAILLVVASVFWKTESKSIHFLDKSFDANTGQCRYFDRLYNPGQVMVLDECQYQCTCHVSHYFEGFLCEPLCGRYIDQTCSDGWENKPMMVPAGPPEFDCFCQEMKCVPSLGIEAFRLR